ncbi:MAG: transcriptional regulator [Gammaproteobacteria bacterium]|nr:MAG: transcriptional regulator [Gammaproteobacteria bacterium]
MSINAYKPKEIKSLSRIFKILGEPNRLKILTSLGLECRPVSAIVASTGLTQTNVSFHLRVLREAGLVKAEKNGSFVFYCLPEPELRVIIDHFQYWNSSSTSTKKN